MGGGAVDLHAGTHNHGVNELLIWQDSVPDGQITLLFRGTKHTHSLSNFLSDLIYVIEVSRASRFTPRFRDVSTHWIGFPKSVTGKLWMKRRSARAKIIAVLLETLMATSIHSTTVECRGDMTPGS
jgi:hypothetical protein